MYSVKQVIVVRKDLNMRKGKIAAQVAHASMKVFFDRKINLKASPSSMQAPLKGVLVEASLSGSDPADVVVTFEQVLNHYLLVPLDGHMAEWAEKQFAKVVVYVTSEDELTALKKAADEKGLPTALIVDSGYTEFHGVPTVTSLAVGPGPLDIVDQITGHLPLL